MMDHSAPPVQPPVGPSAPATPAHPQAPWIRYLAWLPLPLFIGIIAVLSHLDIHVRFEPPYLLLALNIVFLTLISWIVAYLAAKTYLAGKMPAVLCLGCSMWVLGIAAATASVFGYFGMDGYVVTVQDCGSLMAGTLILASALLSTTGTVGRTVERPIWWLPVSYLASLGAMILVTAGLLDGFIPLFFKPDQGTTQLRQMVVIATIVQFVISSVLFAGMYRRSEARFLRWYSLGLGLIAIGLLGALGERQLGTPIAWTARLAQYLGGVYILYAVLSVFRQFRTWNLPVDKALKEIERRHSSLVDVCPDAILVHSEGKYVYANPAAARLFGAASASEVTGKDIFELIAPEFRELARERIRQAYAGAVAPLRETRMIRFDGQRIDVETTGAMVEFRGKPAIQLVARDITQRKQAEAAAARYHLISQHARDPLLLMHLDGRIIEANQAAIDLYGYPRDELLALRLHDLRREGEREAVTQKLQQATSQGVLVERVHVRKDGSLVPVEVSVRRVKVDGQEMILSVIRDITVRKEAEESLRRSERLYRAIGESISYGIWVCDIDGRNIYASESFLKMVGMTQEQCSNFGWSSVLHPDDAGRTIAAWKECVRTGGMWDIEHRFRGLDGQWHDVLARGVPVCDEEGRVTCWAGINLDISRLKRAEEALRQAKEELDLRVQERTGQLLRTIDSLNAEMAQRTRAEQALRERSEQLHLLASELTLAEQRERQRLAQVLHDGLQQILVGAKFRLALLGRAEDRDARRAATEVGELIDDALETSRSLTAELSPPILREAGLVPALEWLARWMYDRHGLTLDLRVDRQAVPAAEDVTVLLFQATRELLFNVVKHSGVKSARVRVTLSDGHIRVTVADEGAGFDPTQLRAAGGRVGGFGLFSIRERLSLLGGRLEIDSAPGQGSRITLAAPASVLEEWSGAAPAAQQLKVSINLSPLRPESAPERRTRVLLADDHIVMRQGLARLLQEEPDIVVVGEASDGESAISLAREIVPDVVLMDISMPGMNGIQATQVIHAELPEIRVIGLSMFDEGERAAAMRQAGAVDYVTKSGPSDAVVAAIRACALSAKSAAATETTPGWKEEGHAEDQS